MSIDLALPVESALFILAYVLDNASKEEIQHALATANGTSLDLKVSHTKREIWKQLARLLRKQLKEY